jgi:aminobenzoyl-glutamate utilization protein B
MDIVQWIDAHAAVFIHASDQVWATPEVKFEEARSAKVLEATLEDLKFRVERGVAGMPTAFVGTYGEGKPLIAILGEFDALPGLSQDRVPYKKPLVEGGPGHGCGHNLLGAGSLAAAAAVAAAIATGDAHGTVRYYGCPAEEGGSGKGYMVREGLFKDVDLTITWHPSDLNEVSNVNTNAVIQAYFRFHGKTAHAAGDPYHGRSALDAVELMNVGVNYLREHMPPEARVHYIITQGGLAANVVPDLAESFYMVRSPQNPQVKTLFERIKAVAQGAALMTETECEVILEPGFSNTIINDTIAGVLQEKLLRIGVPQYSPDELQFAHAIAANIPPWSPQDAGALFGMVMVKALELMKDKVLCDGVMPLVSTSGTMAGSTDVGDVSWVTPTGTFETACGVLGTPGHSWQVVAQSGMGIGHKGMLYAGKVMAAAVIEFMQRPELLSQAQAEFHQRTAGLVYESSIPAGARPPVF